MNEHLCLLVDVHLSTSFQHQCKFLDLFAVHISSELNSFLLIMCINAPEPIPNSGLFKIVSADITFALIKV